MPTQTPSLEVKEHQVRIKRMDVEKRMVEGLVYAPYVLDTWGEMMLPEDIETMAHRFMADLALKGTIDTNHDEASNGSYPVQSFIARKGDPDYVEGSWVLKVHVPEDDTWEKVKKGELNGFSFQAMVYKVAVVVEIEAEADGIFQTEPAGDGHKHYAYVEFDEDGVVISGRTSTNEGHSHEIMGATVTEKSFGHSHRLFTGQ